MCLIEVDLVGLEALERGVELLFNLRSRQPAIVGVHREEGLGREHIAVARAVLERLPEEAFGRAIAIDVGGVDEIDALVERGVEAAPRGVGLDAHAISEPRAEGDVGHVQVRAAELALVHQKSPGERR